MEKTFLNIVSGRSKGLGAELARGSLTALSWGFSAGARLRGVAYSKGWKSITKAPMPVISIGNLTTGGTGKTPMVIWCAEGLMKAGYKVAVLSRGYGAKAGEINDEGQLIQERLPEICLYQNPDRISSAFQAASDGCQVALLDDGFQHRKLHRDLDLVLVDATNPFGYGALLPRGLLREPMTAIQRAGGVLITRAESVSAERITEIRETLKNLGAPGDVWTVVFCPSRLRSLTKPQDAFSLDWLKNQSITVASGIGNPQAFEQSLEQLGATILDRHHFPDHHLYSLEDLDILAAKSQKSSAVLVTEKDAVKLAPLLAKHPKFETRLLALAIDAEVTPVTSLKDRIHDIAAGRSRSA
ncbi:MAG: tetraacyldisaccharide 4'-kinase [Planctomycetota bacterium]|nr:tetraacyldisaccharide 4'-kinase [Planctomycetota bacterium]